MTSWAFAAPFRLSLAGTVGLAADFEAVAGSGSLTVGAQIATLSVVNESGSGSRPYAATVLPLRGVVPSGSHVSNAAGTEAGAILSAHDDGSAAVVVFASTASATGSVALHVATGTAPAALTAAAVTAQVTSVAVAFGSPYGTASITDFSTPERVWWATSKVYCARYRVAAPTPGSTALEAVIDIHAYADRALVEVVVENAKMVTATPTKPDAASYTGATVSINGGAAIATVNAADMPAEAAHSAFRSWYASGWVGTDPGLCVTQLASELQAHPLLWECAQANTFDLSAYASDAYAPWGTGRQRASNMGSGGDHASIGPLPQWEVHFLSTGDYRAAKAVRASALACLGFNINYRDTATGLVPTITALAGKTQQSNWPIQTNGSEAMTWEVAHHPAAGLMAFISRPSPVFIELAQKVAVFNATLTTFEDVGPGTTTGVFGQYYQMRGRAWGIRSLAHATFLTPDALPWKAAGVTSLGANATYLDGWRTDSKAFLNCFWDETAAGTLQDADGVAAGFQSKVWQHHYLTTELHKAASAGLLTGSAQTTLDTIADWAALQPVRWINEQPSGAWKFVPYHTTIGRNATTIDSASDWATQMAWSMTDSPTGTAWKTDYSGATRTTYASFDTTDTGGTGYPGYLWSALVAAVERGVSGAATAWATVQAGISNLSTWRAAFATDPRHGSTPRSGLAPAWVAGISTTQWTEIASSPVFTAALTPLVTPVSGSYRPNNSGAIEAVRDAFGYWTWDEATKCSYIFGGGHLDGSCNAVVKFDATTLTYSVPVAATPPTAYPPSFTAANTPVVYPSGLAGNGFFLAAGGMTDPADTPYAAPFKARTASHSYAALTYWDGKVGIHYGQVGDADLVAGNWSYTSANPYGPQIPGVTTPSYGTESLPNNLQTVVVPGEGIAWMTLTPGDYASNWRSGVIRVDLATHTVTHYVDLTAASPSVVMGNPASMRLNGRNLWVHMPTFSAGTNTAGVLWKIDIDTRAVTYYTLNGSLPSWTVSGGNQENLPLWVDGSGLHLWSHFTDADAIHDVDLTPTSGAGTRASPYQVTVTRRALTVSSMPTCKYVYAVAYSPDWGVVMVNPSSATKWWALKV